MLSCFELVKGHPRFFLGSDSAPHLPQTKSTATPAQSCAAGVYTSPILLPLVAHLLESFDALNQLEAFVSTFGRAFYKRDIVDSDTAEKVFITKVEGGRVIEENWIDEDQEVVPFWSGQKIGWVIVEDTM